MSRPSGWYWVKFKGGGEEWEPACYMHCFPTYPWSRFGCSQWYGHCDVIEVGDEIKTPVTICK